jgi:peptidyl-dipeptidase Dcp
MQSALLTDALAGDSLPPFAQIDAAQFEPAVQQAMAWHLQEIEALGAQQAAPDFDNTAAAFDRAGRPLQRIVAVFQVLAASASSAEIQAVQRRLAAPLAAHHSRVHTDPAVYVRLCALRAQAGSLVLDAEQQRLLQRLLLDFERAGAALPAPA